MFLSALIVESKYESFVLWWKERNEKKHLDIQWMLFIREKFT